MFELKKFKEIYNHLHDGIDINMTDSKVRSIVKGRVCLYAFQVLLKLGLLALSLSFGIPTLQNIALAIP
jgi:hypothetical protein